jgi:ubiquinone/menaquinone biosynthesis C-methylase UbiE
MPFERIEDNICSPWWGEHIHRYEEAIKFISKGSTVLDVACGNGLGTNILHIDNDNITFGVDLSKEIISCCKKKYPKDGISFVQSNVNKLPFSDCFFDVVVSFETIEHTHEYIQMLEEIKRVLKKSGILILSTPNILINHPDGIIKNPYHTQEFTYNELKTLLSSFFPSVNIYGQYYNRYANSNFSIRYKIAKLFEDILYMRGFRKTPLCIQNYIMSLLIKKTIYPTPSDYILISDVKAVMKCKTFVAICK